MARTLIRLVSISARISTELEELKRSQKMSSLWKMHADAVVVLLDMASSSTEDAGSVAQMAEQKARSRRRKRFTSRCRSCATRRTWR